MRGPFYPVVNENDTVLYTVNTKDHLHKNNRLHRGVHIFVEVYGGGFMIQKKAKSTENGGKWSSAASGHVETGETYLMAAKRELKEETGIEAEIRELQEVCKVAPCKETGNEFVTLFTYLMDEDNEMAQPNPDEVEALITAPRDKIIADVERNPDRYSPAFIKLLREFLKSDN